MRHLVDHGIDLQLRDVVLAEVDALDFADQRRRQRVALDQSEEEAPGIDRRDDGAAGLVPLAGGDHRVERPQRQHRVPAEQIRVPPFSSRQRTSASTVPRDPPTGRTAGEPWLAARNKAPAPVPGA